MKFKKLLMAALFVTALSAGTAHSGDIGNGKALFNDVNLGTNGKSCNTCHSGGKDIDGSKNTFKILGSEQEGIEDAANFCIEMALNGKPLEKGSAKMSALASYLRTLRGKKEIESETPGY